MYREETLIRKLREMEEENSMAREQLRCLEVERSIAREEERRRMAYREERIGHSLGDTRRRLGEILRKQLPAHIASDLLALKDLVDCSIRESASVIIELSPAALYSEGLAGAVRWIAAQMERYFGVSIRIEGEFPPLPDAESRIILYQAIREVLVKVVKLSGARNIFIKVLTEENLVRISMEDDGKGLESTETGIPEGQGCLTYVSEALRSMGGFFIFHPTPSSGARSMIVAPCG